MSMHRLVLSVVVASLICFVPSALRAQSGTAPLIPAADLMQPADLAHLLTATGAQRPVVLQVGSHVLFTEAHITGSQYAGPGSQPEGLRNLEHAVASVPKDRLIVLYCGCCPWSHCPNIRPAWKRLHDLGYTQVKALYLANNFGDDWVAKGYPTQRQ